MTSYSGVWRMITEASQLTAIIIHCFKSYRMLIDPGFYFLQILHPSKKPPLSTVRQYKTARVGRNLQQSFINYTSFSRSQTTENLNLLDLLQLQARVEFTALDVNVYLWRFQERCGFGDFLLQQTKHNVSQFIFPCTHSHLPF